MRGQRGGTGAIAVIGVWAPRTASDTALGAEPMIMDRLAAEQSGTR